MRDGVLNGGVTVEHEWMGVSISNMESAQLKEDVVLLMIDPQ